MTGFNSPFLLGFDQLEQMLDAFAHAPQEKYPPYNIEQRSDAAIRISLAVAGFTEETLSIQLENNQLIIKGGHKDDQSQKDYIHRGIATRSFIRRFVLADRMEVQDAFLEHGLLIIDITRPPAQEMIKTIPIRRV